MIKARPGNIAATGNKPPEIIDLRGLEAPEPMERILLACAKLGHQESYIVHLPHVPLPLFPHLQSRGLGWSVKEESDGSAVITIRRQV